MPEGTNGGVIWIRAVLVIAAGGISGWLGKLSLDLNDIRHDAATEIAALQTAIGVLAAEKLRNESEIRNNQLAISCFQSGECGKRWTSNDQLQHEKTIIEQHNRLWDRIEWLADHCAMKEK